MRIDERTPQELKAVIAWSQQSDFWLRVIRSPEKVRKHFESLWLQMEEDVGKMIPIYDKGGDNIVEYWGDKQWEEGTDRIEKKGERWCLK